MHVVTMFYSGRAPLKLSLELLNREGYSSSNPLPPRHAHNITVPGTVAGWVDTVERFGSGKVRVYAWTFDPKLACNIWRENGC